MEQPELEIPGIAVTCQVVGVTLLIGSVIFVFMAFQANSSVVGGVVGISGGFLFFVMGYSLRKLYQIEAHLRLRRIEAEKHAGRLEEHLVKLWSDLQRQ